MSEKIRFCPIDVTYKVIDDKAIILLFGRAEDGSDICVLDRNFQSYFYAVQKFESALNSDLRKRMESLSIERNKEAYSVLRIEETKRKFLGKEINAIKVFTKLPRDVPILSEEIKDWEGIESVNEYDILFVRRYLIDKNIVPMAMYEAEGKSIAMNLKPRAFLADEIKIYDGNVPIHPKILAIDIETYTSKNKVIDFDKNPILMASLYSNDFQKVVTWKSFESKLDYVDFVDNEAELIKRIREYIDFYKPDILAGYFSDGFDLPYIKARADKLMVKFDIGLDFSDLIVNTKNVKSVKIIGITHLDIFRFIRKIMGSSMDTESFNLSSVAEKFLNEKKKDVDFAELTDAWNQGSSSLDRFYEYNLNDAYLCFKLAEKLLPTILELVKMVGLPIYDINRMGYSQLVEWYVLRQALLFNEIAPNKPSYRELQKRRMQSIKGGFVFEPKPGLYNNIVVFDYKSLYPTIIASHNISPESLNCPCCRKDSLMVPIEGKDYWFCKKKKGFLPTIIEDIVTRRTRIKEIVKKEKNALLIARDNALKLLANSFYGYLGFYGSRYYSIESAESTTAFGRHYIKKVIKEAEASGFNVIYSDTDSIFIELGNNSKRDAQEFVDIVNKELPELMELEYEGFYSSGIFVSAKLGHYGAKKKYALISEDGFLKIKGFETVRRNWSAIAKEVQENVINIILKEQDREKAFSYVKGVIQELRDKKVPLSKVIIHTQLQKEIIDYDARVPHVVVAYRLKKQGISVSPGMVIGYVVTSGNDIISNRSRLPEEVVGNDYDPNYYIDNQIVPAVEKLFEIIGYKKEDLLQHKEQKRLEGFF